MCGLAGFMGGGSWSADGSGQGLLERMTAPIAQRGPDDAGYWCEPWQRIAMAHRRLSIVDLSPAGHQPMHSAGRRYVIVFNGEIYNHLLIREVLAEQGRAPAWRGYSDTETLLAGFDAWGIRATLERAVGMFAFAVWDRETAALTLGRDRMGEKPLYYGWQGQGDDAVFLFGSELKALRAHPAFEHDIDRGALSLQLRHNYIPAPYSIYRGIAKLPAGSLATVSPCSREPKITAYWSCVQAAEYGAAHPFSGSAGQAVDALEGLLSVAVKQQMMADVPLGAFLSGGVDSSTVVALMQAQAPRPVKTFSIGFHEAAYNEAQHARAVAAHLGTDHTELYVTPEEALDVIPALPALYDEPFSDSSQIPTHLVSRLARGHVTVSLSGDGGDELFCGYNRYRLTARLWSRIAAKPLWARELAARGVAGIPPHVLDRLAAAANGLLPAFLRFTNPGEKLHKGAAVLGSKSVEELYRGLVSQWDDPGSVVIAGTEPPTMLTGSRPGIPELDDIQRMMVLDMLTYLPDDILVKLDRAAMGVSLETRVPFLAHPVVEFALSVPQELKLRDGESKWLLRQVLYRHVPESLIDRPKMGFAVPLGAWLRGPLRDWAESLLARPRLQDEGFFDPRPIRRKWEEHLSGKHDWQYQLWTVLMFQSWLEQQRSDRIQSRFAYRPPIPDLAACSSSAHAL
ncbi:MAG: asparagine synthase, glutamine-hydrolyzing [Herminiimonas sp.]|nr:asparagine synthase, glutamine-hydrolyzing [Herminiimonas sp.]